MPRDFNVKGTREYLIWAFVLLAAAVWCGKDGWFPSEKVVNKLDREHGNTPYGFTLVELEEKYGVPLPEGFDPETAGDAAEKRYPPPAHIFFDFDNPNNYWRFNRTFFVISLVGSIVLFVIHRAVN